MATKILQINFTFNVPRAAYEQAVAPMADDFAAVPGCRWKIWLMNEANNEAGGIYHFESDAALTTFLNSPLVSAVTSHPALSDFSVKQFDVMEAITKVTRGPIAATAASASMAA
jgi:sulfur transfer protein SufE